MNKKHAPPRRAAGFLCALLLLLCAPWAAALDDDEFDGYAADTLTIKVGYFGGPYYEKRVFTLEELWAMDVVYGDYTFIDNMPSVVVDHVAGVRLSDLMDAAGIDLNSVQTFYFWTRDKQSDYYTSYPKSELIDTPRYCYYSLPENFDSEEGAGNAQATAVGERVDTLIALADDWNRTIAGGGFGSDYLNLNTNTRFRLIFGQTDAVTRTANRSAKWIHEIVVELGGAPTLTLDASALEGKVGSVLRTVPQISAADSAIAQGMQLTWTSSDERVATVDEAGNITVHAPGAAVITAAAGGVSASVTVTGSEAAQTPPALPTGGPAGGDGDGGGGAAPQNAASTGPVEITADPDRGEQPDTRGETSLVPPKTKTEGDTGGVQNWRVYEMAQGAMELPIVPEETPLLPVTGLLALCLFAGGFLLRVLKYKKDVKD